MFTSCFILHIPFRERIFGTLPRVSPGLTKILFFVFVFVAEVSVSVAAFGRVLRRVSLSVAAFGRVLRTLGGRNLEKCRLRAHQHPLLLPLSNLRRARPHVKHPRQDASATRDGTRAGDLLRV